VDFNEKFKEFLPIIRSISYANSRTTGIPKEDFESELCESLWRALQTFDETKGCGFRTWATKLLRQAVVRLIKSKHGTHYRRVHTTIDSSVKSDYGEEETQESSITDNVTAEDEYFRRRHRKKADQRQLIDFLKTPDSGEPDTTTIALVEAYLLAPLDASETAIAKSLGLHHVTADRKLRKLSRRYDANRFGDVNDYLAV
jgi:RNA polymerase sigma factor (sigma-70 family)